MISKYKEFEYTKEKKGKVVCKEFITGMTKSTFYLKKNTLSLHSQDFPSEKAHIAGKVAINKKMIQDILKLKDYIVGYELFYDKIFNWKTSSASMDSDIDD